MCRTTSVKTILFPGESPKDLPTVLRNRWNLVVGFVFNHAIAEKRECCAAIVDPNNKCPIRQRRPESGSHGWVMCHNSALLTRMYHEFIRPRFHDQRESFIVRANFERRANHGRSHNGRVLQHRPKRSERCLNYENCTNAILRCQSIRVYQQGKSLFQSRLGTPARLNLKTL